MKPKFIVGQRVYIMVTSSKNENLRNKTAIILNIDETLFGSWEYTIVVENTLERLVTREFCLAQILYDGNKKVAWSMCAWKPKGMRT